MNEFKEYPIYKKRDGHGFYYESYVFSDSFGEAKKIFAKQMTDDNWWLSNDINWLYKERDGVKETGWYDLSCSVLSKNDKGETDYSKSEMELLCSEEAIVEGFDSWNEDVYTWQLRLPEEE